MEGHWGFLASVFLSEGKSLARFRQGHVLPNLFFALLDALTALRAEVLGEFREGANSWHQRGPLTT
jgi:hypothetical protein